MIASPLFDVVLLLLYNADYEKKLNRDIGKSLHPSLPQEKRHWNH